MKRSERHTSEFLKAFVVGTKTVKGPRLLRADIPVICKRIHSQMIGNKNTLIRDYNEDTYHQSQQKIP